MAKKEPKTEQKILKGSVNSPLLPILQHALKGFNGRSDREIAVQESAKYIKFQHLKGFNGRSDREIAVQESAKYIKFQHLKGFNGRSDTAQWAIGFTGIVSTPQRACCKTKKKKWRDEPTYVIMEVTTPIQGQSESSHDKYTSNSLPHSPFSQKSSSPHSFALRLSLPTPARPG